MAALKKPSRKSKTSPVYLLCLFVLVFLLTADYGFFIYDSTINFVMRDPTYMFVFYHFDNFLLVLLEMQFVLSALEVAKAFQELANMFEDTLHLINTHHVPQDAVIAGKPLKRVPLKSVNTIIDLMAQMPFAPAPSFESISDTVRHLAIMYTELCGVMKQLERCYGLAIILLLISFLLQLVLTTYNILTESSWSFLWYILQTLWFVLRVACAAIIVEPSHKTQLVDERINTLVSRMIINSPDGMVFTELEKFSRFLLVNKAVYCPLGVCTLTRSLVASLFGTVVTYLIIVVQFQISEH